MHCVQPVNTKNVFLYSKMHATVQILFICALAVSCHCETYCWTKWLDRDNPSVTGDWETLGDFTQTQVCPKPVGIECQTVGGQSYESTGKLWIGRLKDSPLQFWMIGWRLWLACLCCAIGRFSGSYMRLIMYTSQGWLRNHSCVYLKIYVGSPPVWIHVASMLFIIRPTEI